MAVKTYSYAKEKSKKVSAHFSVGEFASKNGSTLYSDKVLIDLSLVAMLERLFAVFCCSKAIITSGYRTSEHDKAAGGNGSGFHVKGNAVDIIFYGSDGKVVPSWKICCAAQDMGFNGCGRISENATHLDCGNRAKPWRGDEMKGIVNTSVPDRDFFAYFKVNHPNVYTMLRPKISVWQLTPDRIKVGENSYIKYDDLR